jgi:hypothetical protein
VARTEKSLKLPVRQFLRGLSCDELQFIASFLGACILESAAGPPAMESKTAEWLVTQACADRGAEDRELKMILLMEYLGRSRMQQTWLAVRSGARLD